MSDNYPSWLCGNDNHRSCVWAGITSMSCGCDCHHDAEFVASVEEAKAEFKAGRTNKRYERLDEWHHKGRKDW